jgi:hypothetical protein
MKASTFVALLLLLTACAAAALADDQANEKNLFQQYVEKFGPPGPEHKLLEPLIGTWTAKLKTWTDPTQAPQVSDGTLVRKSILGGRFLHEDFDGSLMDKPFQGMGVMGYDRAKKQFVCSWIDSAGTAVHQSRGTYDEAAKTWTFKQEDTCPITGKPVKMRDTLRIVNDDEEQIEMYRQLGDEKEMKTMEITLTRKK